MRRSIIAGSIAILVAAVCVRLGMWQLDRLAQRQSRNAMVEARMRADTVDIGSIPHDSTARFRHVRVSGTFDYERELVLTGRSRQGSPGVHLLTPLRPAGTGPAVLVNRGWVYSPDASSVDRERWREGSDTTIVGYVDLFGGSGPVRSVSNPRAWRRLDADTVAAAFPYPMAPLVVVALTDAKPGNETPVRLAIPTLDEGPHRGYAFQWFAFGAIALIGVGTLLWQSRRPSQSVPPVT